MDFISRQIGDFQVTALSDGNMSASLDLLSGITTTDAGEIQRSAGVAEPGNLHIYGYLIRGRGRTILVDSGTGAQTTWVGCSGIIYRRLALSRRRSIRCC